MVYVVLDTNIFVSGVISPDSPPAQLLKHWQSGLLTVVSCQRAIDELDDVLQRPHLREKYKISSAKREALLSVIREGVVLVSGESIKGVVTADPKDDMFIACAVEGQAKYIISGDKHLRQLRRYQSSRVVEPAYFLNVLTRCLRLNPQ